jgi:hypothetical protein
MGKARKKRDSSRNPPIPTINPKRGTLGLAADYC